MDDERDGRDHPVERVRDSGQAIGLVLMAVVLVAAVAAGIAGAAMRITARSRAQNAADAAALAGVDGGPDAAAAIAARNGGVLIAFNDVAVDGGATVTVEVTVGDEHAVARASSGP